jgi:hypothetical protein
MLQPTAALIVCGGTLGAVLVQFPFSVVNQAVAMMLLNESGFDPRRMSIAGYAQYHPSASDDTPEARGANRRVDIVVVSVAKPSGRNHHNSISARTYPEPPVELITLAAHDAETARRLPATSDMP